MIALDLCALIPCPGAEDEASVRQHHVPLTCSAGRLECTYGQPETASEHGDTTVTAISSASVAINVLVRPCLQLHVTCAPSSGPRIIPIRALREPKSRPLRTTATVALDTQSHNDNNYFCEVSSACAPAVESFARRSFPS
jgi:hypothetical protein